MRKSGACWPSWRGTDDALPNDGHQAMSGLDRRVARLSPERRRLLERLVPPGAVAEDPSSLSEEMPIDTTQFDFEGDKLRDQDQVRRFYEAVSTQLDAGPFAEHAKFLNYGYVANDNPQHARFRPSPGRVNRNSIRLVLELIGDAAINPEHEVLDVGCGRGGTSAVLRSHFSPRRVVGLDLARTAVAFCHRTQRGADACFLVASAEDLPFAESSFDFVTNVESSHCYERINDFFVAVHSVLRDGGCFLYTDLIEEAHIEVREVFLQSLGFERERKQDITSNVLLSCDETATAHARAFHDRNDPSLIESFLGVPSSALYDAMKDGRQRYLMYRWRKGDPGEPGDTT
jgi:SAM-dependent methyltransferase